MISLLEKQKINFNLTVKGLSHYRNFNNDPTTHLRGFSCTSLTEYKQFSDEMANVTKIPCCIIFVLAIVCIDCFSKCKRARVFLK